MTENKPRRLNEVLGPLAPQGTNDTRWFLIEHQLEQISMSARIVKGSVATIADRPENENERQVAEDCLEICSKMLVDILGHRATILSYLSGTDVPERVSKTEV